MRLIIAADYGSVFTVPTRILTRTLLVLALLSLALFAAHAAAEGFDFHTYPNPLVAGGDPAKVAYRLPVGGTVSIYVYDFDGDLVRTIVEDAKRSAGAHDGDEVWDGGDDGGKIVAPGPYMVVFEARLQGETHRITFVAVVQW
jgi:hypothetical protein